MCDWRGCFRSFFWRSNSFCVSRDHWDDVIVRGNDLHLRYSAEEVCESCFVQGSVEQVATDAWVGIDFVRVERVELGDREPCCEYSQEDKKRRLTSSFIES